MSSLLNSSQRKKRYTSLLTLSLCIFLTIALLALNLFLGAGKFSVVEILQAIINPSEHTQATQVLYYVRLPRILSCVLCGGALANSGLLIQTSLHTPLASPGIIGVNAGAGFAVVLVSFLFPVAFFTRMIASFLGALVAVMIVYVFAHITGASKLTIILAGIAMSSLFTAGSDVIITIDPSVVMDKSAFSLGGFSGVGLRQVGLMAPVIILAVSASLCFAKQFEILTMGDEVALSLGVPAKRVRFSALFLAALLAGSAVSLGGLIGFVGLIAPHISRLLFKTSYKKLVLFSFWFGSLLMLFCDLLARTMFSPYEISVGIVLSFVGVPFFLFLLATKRRK